jgi:hypothetical protein
VPCAVSSQPIRPQIGRTMAIPGRDLSHLPAFLAAMWSLHTELREGSRRKIGPEYCPDVNNLPPGCESRSVCQEVHWTADPVAPNATPQGRVG